MPTIEIPKKFQCVKCNNYFVLNDDVKQPYICENCKSKQKMIENLADKSYDEYIKDNKMVDTYERYQYMEGFIAGYNYANKVHYYPEELPKEKGLYLTFMYFKGDNEHPENKNSLRIDSRMFDGEGFVYESFDTYFKIYAWQDINVPERKS